MDLEDLHIFRTVVQCGGITAAAAQLHRVQSNVTTRIRQLEADLGVSLFVREQRRLHLAPAGRLLLDYAEQLLTLAAEARQAVTDDAPRGRLRLGSMESTAAARLPGVMASLHQAHPAVELELQTGPTARMTAAVLQGRLDCALVSAPIHDERLAVHPVFTEELVLVAPLQHPLVTCPRDLAPRTLLTFEAGCAYRLILESWLASQGVVAEKVVELSSYHTMLGCAAAGMGIALIPASLLERLPEARHVSRHPLPAPIGQVDTVLIHKRQGSSAATRALLQALRQSGPEVSSLETTGEKPRPA